MTIAGTSFQPRHRIALVNDAVRWTNTDFSQHNVVAHDGSFSSPVLERGNVFSHDFTTEGTFSYRCTIHPFMVGAVAVFRVYLAGPTAPVLYGRHALVSGLAPADSPVTIERVAADGTTEQVATATPAADGSFSVSVAALPAQYRAVAAAGTSPLVRVHVRPRVAIRARRSGGRIRVSVSTSPSQAGAPVVLERRKRFSWVRVARGRLNARSRASFRLAPTRPIRVRARLLRGVGGYAPGTSPSLLVRP